MHGRNYALQPSLKILDFFSKFWNFFHKGKALKVLREHGSLSFNLLGDRDLSCDFDALYSMAVQFLSLCYGIKPENQQSSIIPNI